MSERNQRLSILMTTLCVVLWITSTKFDWEIIVIIAMFFTGAGLEYKHELFNAITKFGSKQ